MLPDRVRPLLLTCAVLTTACTPYRDFTLPPPEGSHTPVQLSWRPNRDPVLSPAAPPAWDSVDVLNPSIVKYAGLYWNFYSGFDGRTWHTGVATSEAGTAWSRLERVISPDPARWEGNYIAANGSALRSGQEFLYWYQAGSPPQIGLARSGNARKWTKHPQPVLKTGPRGSWDERGVADPYVIRARGRFYMFYLGQDRARRQRLGVAVSDDAIRWVKLLSNPVLQLGPPGSFDEQGLGEPAVWSSHGRWWMLYTGRDARENRRLGLAESRDGISWTKVEGFMISGDQPWNSRVVCDPEVEVRPDGVRVWFGGGDVARPDERLNGRIGMGSLLVVAAASRAQ